MRYIHDLLLHFPIEETLPSQEMVPNGLRSDPKYAQEAKCKSPKSRSKAIMKQQVICGFRVFAHKASIHKDLSPFGK